MKHVVLIGMLCVFTWSWTPWATAFAGSGRTLVVSDVEELKAAMVPENAGQNILIRAGTYCLNSPITVPAGSRVEGEGMMLFDGRGHPTGFDPPGLTQIIAGDGPVEGGNPCPSDDGPFVPDLDSAVLKMEDGGSIRGVQITGIEPFGGNTVRIQAQGEERTRASVVECDIQGAGGELLSATDRNVGRTFYIHTGIGVPDRDPPWDPELENPPGDPEVAVDVRRSIVRGNKDIPASTGMAFYVINHESKGSITLSLEENVLTEAAVLVDAIGGGSRREIYSENGETIAVDNVLSDAKTEIISYNNQYRSSPFGVGFSITAGAAAPFPLGDLGTPGAQSNQLIFHSFYDNIEGVALAVFAKTAFRSHASHGQSHDNSMDIQMIGTTMSSAILDLFLVATIAAAPVDSVGDNNTLTFLGRQLIGSGPAHSLYATDFGPQTNPGTGNELNFIGSLPAWLRTNQGIDAPSAEFFRP